MLDSNEHLNSSIFSRYLKMGGDVDVVMSGGKLFHTGAEVTPKT